MTLFSSVVSLTFNYALAKVYKNGRIWIIRMHILFLCDTFCMIDVGLLLCVLFCCGFVIRWSKVSTARYFVSRKKLFNWYTHLMGYDGWILHTLCLHNEDDIYSVWVWFVFLFLLPSILLDLSEFSTVEGKSNPKASKLLFVLKHGDSECLIVVVNI